MKIITKIWQINHSNKNSNNKYLHNHSLKHLTIIIKVIYHKIIMQYPIKKCFYWTVIQKYKNLKIKII